MEAEIQACENAKIRENLNFDELFLKTLSASLAENLSV